MIIDILMLIRAIIRDMAILFFLTLAVVSAFTNDFNISQTSALIVIALILIEISEKVTAIKKGKQP